MGSLTVRGTPCFCRLSRTSEDISPKPEAGVGRGVYPAPRGIGAVEGGSLLPGVTLQTPLCRARGRGSRAERGRQQVGGGGGSGPREAREARAEARPRAGWARLLQDPPGRRHKGLHKKGLGKGCFGLKLDRIGAMSGLGC
uniref:C-type natriuretic peptide n=1 Tax=Cyanoderma ruficeps TaxID=181631 RepID=A0A8C3R1Q1_9PASS